MVFTIEEIRHYLNRQNNLADAIRGLTEQAIVECIPIDDFDGLNFEKNEENLLKYEAVIGMTKRKEEQRMLHQNTNGKKGRYWMACSPRWIQKTGSNGKPTKYKIAYWVNYGDDMTYGLFTVEEIQKWFDNPKIFLHDIGGTKER